MHLAKSHNIATTSKLIKKHNALCSLRKQDWGGLLSQIATASILETPWRKLTYKYCF